MAITSKAKSYIGDNVIVKVKVVIGPGGRWLEPVESSYATTNQMATHVGSAKVFRSYCPARWLTIAVNYDSIFQRGQIWQMNLGTPHYDGYYIIRSRSISKKFGEGTTLVLKMEKKDLPFADAIAPLLHKRGMVSML